MSLDPIGQPERVIALFRDELDRYLGVWTDCDRDSNLKEICSWNVWPGTAAGAGQRCPP